MNIGSLFGGISVFESTKSLGSKKSDEDSDVLSIDEENEKAEEVEEESKKYDDISDELFKDNNQLNNLMSALRSGDMSVIQDIKEFQLDKITINDYDLKTVYNENLSTLSQLQAYATAYSEDDNQNGKKLNTDC